MPSSFLAALGIGWVTLALAAVGYALLKDIPAWAATPVAAAFLLEYSFYLVPGFERMRERLEALLSPRKLALGMTASAGLPYSVYAAGTGQFEWHALAAIVSIAAAISFWYTIARRHPAIDVLFLGILAAILLGKVFDLLYPSPVPQIRDLDVLGHLMLIRLSALAMLSLRRVKGVGFGFIPRRTEWRIGLVQYALFLPVGFPLAVALGVVTWRPELTMAARAILTFAGVLWVVALSEEFFFRGLIQQWVRDWTGRPQFALLLTAVLFGAVHLPFRGFPNWRFALVAALAGWFYGRAYQKAGSIRAPMVTHALVVTTWRSLFG